MPPMVVQLSLQARTAGGLAGAGIGGDRDSRRRRRRETAQSRLRVPNMMSSHEGTGIRRWDRPAATARAGSAAARASSASRS